MAEEPEQVLPENRPAALAEKTCAPSFLSISSTSSAAASTGKASSTSIEVSRMFQVNIGIRNMVMPGARMHRWW